MPYRDWDPRIVKPSNSDKICLSLSERAARCPSLLGDITGQDLKRYILRWPHFSRTAGKQLKHHFSAEPLELKEGIYHIIRMGGRLVSESNAMYAELVTIY